MAWAPHSTPTVHTETQTRFQTAGKEEEKCVACLGTESNTNADGGRTRKWDSPAENDERERERKEELGAIKANANCACLTNFLMLWLHGICSLVCRLRCITHPSLLLRWVIRFGFGHLNTHFISLFLRPLFLFLIAVVVAVLCYCRNFNRNEPAIAPIARIALQSQLSVRLFCPFCARIMPLNWIAKSQNTEFKSHWFYIVCNFIYFFRNVLNAPLFDVICDYFFSSAGLQLADTHENYIYYVYDIELEDERNGILNYAPEQSWYRLDVNTTLLNWLRSASWTLPKRLISIKLPDPFSGLEIWKLYVISSNNQE